MREYSPELADEICGLIASGQSLNSICKRDDMPSQTAVFNWLAKYPDMLEKYARARESQADVLFDEILEIADEGKRDTYIDENGVERTDHDVVARSRLRVDARKWMAGKLRPKKYGDSLDVKTEIGLSNPLMELYQQINGTSRSK